MRNLNIFVRVSTFFTCIGLIIFSNVALGDDKYSASASSHAPIGVMGDHLHNKGEFMVSYRYMRMSMQGNRIGTQRVSDRSVVGTASAPGQFMVVPTKMPMDMHMFGAMYGLSDKITLMGSVSYLDNSMDHLIRNGLRFTTASSGIGDTKISALIRLYGNQNRKIHMGLGVSLPTGSTTERDDTPAMQNAFLPYPMQLGSGTYDLLPSLTFRDRMGKISWGGQASAIIRLSDNDQGYTLGDQVHLSSWLARDLGRSVSASLRIKYQDTERIDGSNPALNSRMIQTADPALSGGERLDGLVGVNYVSRGGHRFALEYSVPLSQDLAGPQLELDSTVTIGWQKAF